MKKVSRGMETVAIDFDTMLEVAMRATRKAMTAILAVYRSNDFRVEVKGDLSPLTVADRQSHEIIGSILGETRLPILSEEGKEIPYQVRKDWELFWMVDPLDGTKEFIRRNGEFTVNIALINKTIPVLGVVGVPTTGEVFFAVVGRGAYVEREGKKEILESRRRADLKERGLRVIASRSHMNPDTERFISGLTDPIIVSAGSSLKFIQLALGSADVYPRFAPTMEWDTAAGHAIVEELGLQVRSHPDSMVLRYNKESLLNPHFLVS